MHMYDMTPHPCDVLSLVEPHLPPEDSGQYHPQCRGWVRHKDRLKVLSLAVVTTLIPAQRPGRRSVQQLRRFPLACRQPHACQRVGRRPADYPSYEDRTVLTNTPCNTITTPQ